MRTRDEILAAVQKHHDNVIERFKKRETDVLMTVLVGSQNYDLADEASDIDTVSFVLPCIGEIALLRDPIATEYDMEDGKCCVKDMRAALNLLKKTNPNSIEWFCSNYTVYDPRYEKILKKFFSADNRNEFLYCDIFQMESSCKGMIKQLKNRNMPAGKKYSHALRVFDMFDSYINVETDNILKFRNEATRLKALKAKRWPDNSRDTEFQKKSEEIAEEITKKIEEINNSLPTDNSLAIQTHKNKESIDNLQIILTLKNFNLRFAEVFGQEKTTR